MSDQPMLYLGGCPLGVKLVAFDLKGPDARVVWVSPDHGRLYDLAQEAEANGDRDLMAAVVKAARTAVETHER